MTNINRPKAFLLASLFLALVSPSLKAQNKLLTIEEIYDPVKRVNFNGTTPTIRWLRDGDHYLLWTKAASIASITVWCLGSAGAAEWSYPGSAFLERHDCSDEW